MAGGSHRTIGRRRIRFGRNVDYPAGFDPESWIPNHETGLYAGLERMERKDEETGVRTEYVLVNLGPQHPSTHGVFRMAARLDGETVIVLNR